MLNVAFSFGVHTLNTVGIWRIDSLGGRVGGDDRAS